MLFNYFRFFTKIIFIILIIKTNQQNSIHCDIKNCQNCLDLKSCSICKPDFELYKKKCYSTKCSIYGHCSLCNEYDCVKCNNGYLLLYGTCDVKEKQKFYIKFLTYFIPIFVIFIISIIYIAYKHKKKNIIPIIKDNVIKKKHPKCGNYIIINSEKNNNFKEVDNSINLSEVKTNSSTIYEKETEKIKEISSCVLCEKKKIFLITDCGCGLCKDHYKKIKNGEKLLCPIHNILLEKNYVITLEKKSELKGNFIEHLGEQLCPICKIHTGIQGFNCNCNMKLCLKCFNENVYVFKYNTCPGCGKKN